MGELRVHRPGELRRRTGVDVDHQVSDLAVQRFPLPPQGAQRSCRVTGQERPVLVHEIFAGMISANIVFVAVGLLGANVFALLVRVSTRILVPIVWRLILICADALYNTSLNV